MNLKDSTTVNKYVQTLIKTLLRGDPKKEYNPLRIEKLKDVTFNRESLGKLGGENYLKNLKIILNYQNATSAPLYTLLLTIRNILSYLVDEEKQIKYLQDDFLVRYLILFLQKHGKIDSYEEELVKDYNSVFYSFKRLYYHFINLENNAELKEFYELDEIDGKCVVLFNDIYEKIGYEQGLFLFYVFKQNKNLQFCVIYPLKDRGMKFSEDQLLSLYSYEQFSLKNHPAKELNSQINTYIEDCFSKYRKYSDNSELYDRYLFDISYYDILDQNVKQGKKGLKILRNIQNRWRPFIRQCIEKNINSMKGVTNIELTHMKKKYLFGSYKVCKRMADDIVGETSIKDMTSVFRFFNHRAPYFSWYTQEYNIDQINNVGKDYGEVSDDSIGGSEFLFYQKMIFELARMFLYSKIGKEQFDEIYKMYPYTISDSKWSPRLRILYNLVLGKFCFAYVKIGTELFTEGYSLLLKQLFKNFRLCVKGNDGLEIFENIGKDSANEYHGILGDDDSELIDTINEGEGLTIEFKSSILLNRKDKLSNGKNCEMETISFLKPVVAFLNGNEPAQIIVGIREKEKIGEELDKNTFTFDDLNRVGLSPKPKINGHYVTGVDEDFVLLGNKSEDNLKQRIDVKLREYIPKLKATPGLVSSKFVNFEGKKLLILNVIPGNDVYYLSIKRKEGKKTIEVGQEVFLRRNASDQKLDSDGVIKLAQDKLLKNMGKGNKNDNISTNHE